MIRQSPLVVLGHQQSRHRYHCKAADSHENSRRIDAPYQGVIADEKGPMNHAVAVGGQRDDKCRGDKNNLQNTTNPGPES